MYLKLKLLFLFWVLCFSSLVFSQSFSFSGPTSSVTVPFGSTQAAATYQFQYYNIDDLYFPELVVSVDGDVVSSGMCNPPSSWTPSIYSIYLSPGVHTVQFSLLSLDEDYGDCFHSIIWDEYEFTLYSFYKIRIENNFAGGLVNVNGQNKNSPHDKTVSTETVNIGAISPQTDGEGYTRIWNMSGNNLSDWQKQPFNLGSEHYSSNQSTSYYASYSTSVNTRLIAGLRKVCNINFQNYFEGVGNGGVIKVNSVQYNSPKTDVSVVELNPVTAEAVYQVINGIEYSFVIWSTGSTNSSTTFNPGSSTTYTAEYVGRPYNNYRNLNFGTTVGQPISLLWSEHPNTNVTQYQIWRRVKHNGVMGSDVLIGTRNRGTTSFTDIDYILTSTYSHDLLYYDVRAYYATEGTYANPDFVASFGRMDISAKIAAFSETIPQENMLYNNYPNPFNPTTQIKYALKEDGFVTLKVYDILGNIVATLVNEAKVTGYYTADFNASDLSSGIYIYSIKINDFSSTKKMILTR